MPFYGDEWHLVAFGDIPLPSVVFGDRLTADHASMNEENKSAEDGALCACVIQDGATNWLQSYPCKTKRAAGTLRCFQRFLEPDVLAKYIYTDNSKEFAVALHQVCVCHDTCTPYTLASNVTAEKSSLQSEGRDVSQSRAMWSLGQMMAQIDDAILLLT